MTKNFLILLIITLFTISSSSLLFKLKDNNPQCVGGEFFGNSILVVKYRLYTKNRKDLGKVIPTLSIDLRDVKKDKTIYSRHIFMVKDKLTYDIAEEGLYEVCIKTIKYKTIRDLGEDLYINIKINPDYNDEDPNLSNAINSEDVNSIAIKAKEIIEISRPIIDGQEKQLEIENEHSIDTLSNANLYRYLTFGQIAVIIFIGLIQVHNFRRFLKSQNVI